MSTESPDHSDHLLQVLKWSLWILILYTFFNYYIHVYSPGARADKPLGSKFWCQQKALTTSIICCKFQTNLWILILYTFLMFFHMYIAPGQEQTTLCGQTSDVNRKECHFAHSFKIKKKKYLWSLTLYIIFHVFIHVYSPGAGADNPLGSEFLF